MNGIKYNAGDIVDVTTEQATRLVEQRAVKYQLGPVAHKMIMSPKEVK